ncbi:hypothetical protein [Nocardioides sp.]|uniref:hypothetical protein n=1 Tax=Nocardioides sp. TaxID=35761 RepID=UPI0026042F48|nr:hypothetical protein [Nocardioides sp.]MCW2737544.1 hypothetical protein [Nocardioides sp.]
MDDTFGQRSVDRWSVDVEAARHATEPSRYLLAVLTGSVVLGLLVIGGLWSVGAGQSLVFVAGAIGLLAFIWLSMQVFRVRLLGRAIKVSPRSTPELAAVVETVRSRLSYTKRTDVYVTDAITQNMAGQSVFGIRILLLKGDFVAELLDDDREVELIFLLATYFGALKARFDRLNVVLLGLSVVNAMRLVDPLLKPWYRATVYTGDQLAFLCCNDLRVSLSAAFRSLVGKRMAPLVRPDGVVEQAASVRRSVILRLAQLTSDSPHPTNRYLNLLAFAATQQAAQYDAFVAGLDRDAAEYVAAYRSGHRAVPGNARLHGAAEVTGGLLVAGSVVIGLAIAGDGQTFLSPTEPTQAPAPSDVTEPAVETPEDSETTEVPVFDYDSLSVDLPDGFRANCTDNSQAQYEVFGDALDAAGLCQPTAPGTPSAVQINQFTSAAAADEAFLAVASDLGAPESGAWADADCATDAPAWFTWTNDSQPGGSLGCFVATEGQVAIFWKDDQSRRVSVAVGEPDNDFAAIIDWWSSFPVL